MKIYTIGFTKKTASEFFGLLHDHGVNCLVDIRLHPGSQLAGFAKREDLAFFLARINGCQYVYLPELAPTKDLLSNYRQDKDWAGYESAYNSLMDERNVPASLDRHLFEDFTCCLLCSEAAPDHCHRRLVAERIHEVWQSVEIFHLI